jgi:hypothetical protein
LTDAEMAELLADVRAAVTGRMGRDPGQGRNRRMISLVAMPTEEAPRRE